MSHDDDDEFALVRIEVPPLDPGEQLAPGLVVLTHLGRGKHGDVYHVLDETRGAQHAAKVPRPDKRADDVNVARIVGEAALLARIDHDSVVRAIGRLAEPPGALFEYLSGETLEALLHRVRRLSWFEVGRLGAQLGGALVAVHGAGALHCDLKPANVMVSRGGYVLIDFDLSRAPGRTRGGLGTHRYMPPEQAAGGELTNAADAFGLGVVLYRAATGKLPFPAHADDAPPSTPAPPVESRRPDGGALGPLIDALLTPEPASRPILHEWVREWEVACTSCLTRLPLRR